MFSLTSLTSRVVSPHHTALLNQTRPLSLLSRLHPSHNSTFTIKRVGRGPSSGYGKTSSRGQKGQKARGTVKPWFEGGQTPITKLFPKIGFKRVNAPELDVLNLKRIIDFVRSGRLQLEDGEVLTMRKMKQVGLVTGTIKDGVKILADGKEELNFPLKVEASRASTEAIRAIEKAGGEFTARYFSRLSLSAHLHPVKYFLQRGHVPLEARPTRRRDVHYYSRVDKRGYLIKEQNVFMKAIENAQKGQQKTRHVKSSGVSSLETKTTNGAAQGYQSSGIVKLADLQL